MRLSQAYQLHEQLAVALGPDGFEFAVRYGGPHGYEITVTGPEGHQHATVTSQADAELLLQKPRPPKRVRP